MAALAEPVGQRHAEAARRVARIPVGVAIGVLVSREALSPTAGVGLARVVAGVATMGLPVWADAGPRVRHP